MGTQSIAPTPPPPPDDLDSLPEQGVKLPYIPQDEKKRYIVSPTSLTYQVWVGVKGVKQRGFFMHVLVVESDHPHVAEGREYCLLFKMTDGARQESEQRRFIECLKAIAPDEPSANKTRDRLMKLGTALADEALMFEIQTVGRDGKGVDKATNKEIVVRYVNQTYFKIVSAA